MSKLCLIPEPKEVIRKEGRLHLPSPVIVVASHNLLYEQIENWKELIEERGKCCITLKKAVTPQPNALYSLSLSASHASPHPLKINLSQLKAQEYYLSIDSSIHLVSLAKEGIFYGLQTLLQTASSNKSSLSFPKLTIKDWPDIPRRGLHFIPQGYRMDYLKKMIRILAQYKMNALLLDFYGAFKFKKYPPIGDKGAMTAAQVKELVSYAQRWQIEVFPSIASFAHVPYILKHRSYDYLREAGQSFQLCPTHPSSFRLMRQLYQEVIPLFKSPYFHIGGDETYFLGACPDCASRVKKVGYGGLYLEFILKLYRFLKTQGKIMVLWGDMLLRFPEIIKDIPKDIVVMNWNYRHQKDCQDRIKFPSINLFKTEKLQTMVASAATASRNYTYAVLNSQNLCRVAYQEGTLAAFVTTWPAVQIEMEHLWYPVLSLAEYGWSSQGKEIDSYQRNFCQSFYGLKDKRLISVFEILSEDANFSLPENLFDKDWLKINPQKAGIFLDGIRDKQKRLQWAYQTLEKILPEAKYQNSPLEFFLLEAKNLSGKIKRHIALAKVNILLEQIIKTYRQNNSKKTNQVLEKILTVIKDERNELSKLINALNKRWFLNRRKFEETNIFEHSLPGRVEVIEQYQKQLEKLNKRINLLSSSPEKLLKKVSLISRPVPPQPISSTPKIDCWLKRSQAPKRHKVIAIGNKHWEIELMPELGGRMMKIFSYSIGQNIISNRYKKMVKEKPKVKQYRHLPNWGGVFDRVFYNGEYLPRGLELLPALPYAVQIIRNSPSEIKIALNCLTPFLKIKRTIRLKKNSPYLDISITGQSAKKEAVIALESVISLKGIQGDDYQADYLIWQESRDLIKMPLLILPQYKIIDPALSWIKVKCPNREKGLLIELNKGQLSPSEALAIWKTPEDYHLIIRGQRRLLPKDKPIELKYRIKATNAFSEALP